MNAPTDPFEPNAPIVQGGPATGRPILAPRGRPVPMARPSPYPAEADTGGTPENLFSNVDFLRKLEDTDYPHRGAGKHIPMWVTPSLAQKILMEHGQTGHAIPHPNINLDDLTK